MNDRIARHLDTFKRTLQYLNENATVFPKSNAAAVRSSMVSLSDAVARIEKAGVSAIFKQIAPSKARPRHGRC